MKQRILWDKRGKLERAPNPDGEGIRFRGHRAVSQVKLSRRKSYNLKCEKVIRQVRIGMMSDSAQCFK